MDAHKVNVYDMQGVVLVVEIETYLHAEDAASLRDAAHTLKSSSANLGATALTKLCKSIELDSGNGELDRIHEELSLLKEELLVVRNALNKVLTVKNTD